MAVFRRRWPGLSYGRGENWHYVGETGEPAFGADWSNSGTTSEPATAFRIREAGIVDLFINAQNTVDSGGSEIFTLSTEYRPSVLTFTAPVYGQVSGGGSYVGLLKVQANGQVLVSNFKAEDGTDVAPDIIGPCVLSFYLDPPILISLL